MSLNTEPFVRYLCTELDIAVQLYEVLNQELDVLKDLSLEALQALQPHKQQLLTQLQQTAEQRLQWMTQQQLPHSPACLQHDCLAAHQDIPLLWQQLADQYDNNRRLSEQLSQLVLQARHRTQQRLQILRGGNNDPHLYNEQGKAKGVNTGQGYVQA